MNLEQKLYRAVFELGDMITHRGDVDQAIVAKQQEIAALRSAIALKEGKNGPVPTAPAPTAGSDADPNGTASATRAD